MPPKIILQRFRWILDGNLWLGSCASALTLYVGLLKSGNFWVIPALWVGAYAVCAYNLHGMSSLRRKQLFDMNAARYFKSKLALMVTFSSMAISLLLILLAPSFLWLPIFLSFMASFIYGNKLNVRKFSLPALREWPYLKGLWSVLALVGIIVVIPCLWMEHFLDAQDYSLIVFLSLHLFINTSIGDLRDLQLDRQKGLKTLPVLWGFQRSKMGLIALSIVLGAFAIGQKNWPLTGLFFSNSLGLAWIKPESAMKIYHGVDLTHWIPLVVYLGLNGLH
jgi:hypothetical protein